MCTLNGRCSNWPRPPNTDAGRVWLGVHEADDRKVAVKIISKTELAIDKDLNEKVEREIATMKLINHPHVLALHDVYESRHNLYVYIW